MYKRQILGERSTKIDWIAIIIILTGLVCFFLEELSFQQFWGNALALLSGAGFAGLTLYMRKQKNDNPIDSVLVGNIITFLLKLNQSDCHFFVSSCIVLILQSLHQIIKLKHCPRTVENLILLKRSKRGQSR